MESEVMGNQNWSSQRLEGKESFESSGQPLMWVLWRPKSPLESEVHMEITRSTDECGLQVANSGVWKRGHAEGAS